jgi:tetraacyldisaccharide 4'-kinase
MEPAIDPFALADRPVLAFAGIGRPDKFFAMLRRLGLQVARTHAFPDHHPYDEDTVMRLVEEAAKLGARPVTTEKDFVRLPEDARAMVEAIPVALVWHDEAALDRLLDRVAPP